MSNVDPVCNTIGKQKHFEDFVQPISKNLCQIANSVYDVPNNDIMYITLLGCDQTDSEYTGITRQLQACNDLGISDDRIFAIEYNKIIYNRIVKGLQTLDRGNVTVYRCQLLKGIHKIIKLYPSHKFIINADLCCWYNNLTTDLVHLLHKYNQTILGLFINISASRIDKIELNYLTDKFESQLIDYEISYEMCPYRGNKTDMNDWFLTYLDGVI